MTDTKELRKLAEAATPGPWNYYDDSLSTGRIEIVALGKTVTRIYRSVPEEDGANAEFIAAANPQTIIALLDTIEAQAAEIERQNATIDSYINTAAVLAAKVEAQSAEIERLKASFTNELDSLSNRNYQLRMANADQAALLKRCKEAMGWHYKCTDCTEALAAIELWENGK